MGDRINEPANVQSKIQIKQKLLSQNDKPGSSLNKNFVWEWRLIKLMLLFIPNRIFPYTPTETEDHPGQNKTI